MRSARRHKEYAGHRHRDTRRDAQGAGVLLEEDARPGVTHKEKRCRGRTGEAEREVPVRMETGSEARDLQIPRRAVSWPAGSHPRAQGEMIRFRSCQEACLVRHRPGDRPLPDLWRAGCVCRPADRHRSFGNPQAHRSRRPCRAPGPPVIRRGASPRCDLEARG